MFRTQGSDIGRNITIFYVAKITTQPLLRLHQPHLIIILRNIKDCGITATVTTTTNLESLILFSFKIRHGRNLQLIRYLERIKFDTYYVFILDQTHSYKTVR